MGTFGVEIFEDDLALDIKSIFEEHLEKGSTVEKATKAILEEYEDDIIDEDYRATILFALAKLQMEKGKLQKSIKNKVLKILMDDNHLSGFEEDYEERKKVIAGFKDELISFQEFKDSTKVEKPKKKLKPKLKLGDVFEFKIVQEEFDLMEDDIPMEIRMRADKGYGIVVNERDYGAIFIEFRRVNKENPTIEDIVSGKIISYKWSYNEVNRYDESYITIGNIEVEPIELECGWSIMAKDVEDFRAGKEVDILIMSDKYPMKKPAIILGTTRDVSILKKMYKSEGIGTWYTLKRVYLLTYNRDENDISTLRY